MGDQAHPRLPDIIRQIAALPNAQQEEALCRACGRDHQLKREAEAWLNARRELDETTLRTQGTNSPGTESTDTDSSDNEAAHAASPHPVAGAKVSSGTKGLGTTVRADTQLTFESSGTIGDYELLSELGRGGMGIVYRARQKSLDRIVAVKVLRYRGEHASVSERFRLEVDAVATLDHPNIFPIFDTGETEDGP